MNPPAIANFDTTYDDPLIVLSGFLAKSYDYLRASRIKTLPDVPLSTSSECGLFLIMGAL